MKNSTYKKLLKQVQRFKKVAERGFKSKSRYIIVKRIKPRWIVGLHWRPISTIWAGKLWEYSRSQKKDDTKVFHFFSVFRMCISWEGISNGS